MRSIVFISSVLMAASIIEVESNLQQSQNVFGCQQKQKRVNTITAIRQKRRRDMSTSSAVSSSSPLRRSENVFGWQLKTRRGNQQQGVNIKSIQQTTSTSSIQQDEQQQHHTDYNQDNTINSNNNSLSPPNIKLMTPRKKELWLPWPLGAMRTDFYKFAEEIGNNNNQKRKNNSYYINGASRQEWSPRDINDSGDRREGNVLQQGREFGMRMLKKGEEMLPFDTNIFNSQQQRDNSMISDSSDSSNKSGYWIKETTTPMATATKQKWNNKKKHNNKKKTKHNGTVLRGGESNSKDTTNNENNNHFDKDVLCQYLKLQASVRLRQLGYVGSDFSVHLPPAAPILLFYYMLPSKQDPIRRLVKYTVCGAGISWIHSEVTKYRRFAPLPGMRGVNVRMPNLPPYLPPLMDGEWVDDENSILSSSNDKGGDNKATSSKASKKKEVKIPTKKEEEDDASSSDHHHHLWDPFQSFGTISSAYRQWLEGYNLRNKRAYQQRRVQAEEELLELQKIPSNSTQSNGDMGYALVTGASSGIGRALAVELARYHIPLILVARDLDKLSTVAKDIETYYDVPCRILQADLNAADCGKRIHAATKKAGLKVDILVNNAGVCAHGDFLEGDIEDVTRMVQVNIGAVTQLSQLYGKDMKERRRGRILITSSMAGVLPGNPSVAVYSATKAFGKSFSQSLGREMEKYGVGVTCLLPGAVKDTSFASRSNVEEAACFHFPGYAIEPELVAAEGIKSLMLGYPESYAGWQNRAFVKTMLPMLPPRISTMVGEWAWSPWHWGDIIPNRDNRQRFKDSLVVEQDIQPQPQSTSSSHHTWKFPRLPTSSNELHLPREQHNNDVLEEFDKLNAVFVSPLEDATILAEEKKSEISHATTEDGKSASSPQAITESRTQENESDTKDKKATPVTDEESIKQTPQKAQNTIMAPVAVEVPNSNSLVLPPASSSAEPKPTSPLFGFFEKDKAVSGGENTEDNSLDDEKEQSIIPPPSMMDKKEYDFRDRRLDY